MVIITETYIDSAMSMVGILQEIESYSGIQIDKVTISPSCNSNVKLEVIVSWQYRPVCKIKSVARLSLLLSEVHVKMTKFL